MPRYLNEREKFSQPSISHLQQFAYWGNKVQNPPIQENSPEKVYVNIKAFYHKKPEVSAGNLSSIDSGWELFTSKHG